jgi:hypothetical protein
MTMPSDSTAEDKTLHLMNGFAAAAELRAEAAAEGPHCEEFLKLYELD